MGAPNGETPDKALNFTQLSGMADYTQEDLAAADTADIRNAAEDARFNLLNVLLGGFLSVGQNAAAAVNQFISNFIQGLSGLAGSLLDLLDYFDGQAADIAAKPDTTEIPLTSPMWQTFNPLEESTFPRSSLNFGASSSTSSGGSSTASAHTHGLGQVPDYQPSGNGTNYAEIGFIKISRDGEINGVGLITGDNATFASIGGAYVGVYKMNASTGDLTLLNTTSAATDRKSSLTSKNTESLFALESTWPVAQGDVLAVAVLQITNALQTPGSLIRTSLTNMARASATVYPQRLYAYAGTYSALPATILQTALHFDQSTKLPFYYVRRTT